MQMLADEKRAGAKAAKLAAARAPKPAGVKEAGRAFAASMKVDSAYEGELFDDFNAWLFREKVAK